MSFQIKDHLENINKNITVDAFKQIQRNKIRFTYFWIIKF